MDTTTLMKRFRVQLAQNIKAQGYSYRNFSLSLGRSENYITNIISGKTTPSLESMLEISDALSMQPGDLLNSSEDPFELVELIPKLRKLSTSELARFSKLVDLMKEEQTPEK